MRFKLFPHRQIGDCQLESGMLPSARASTPGGDWRSRAAETLSVFPPLAASYYTSCPSKNINPPPNHNGQLCLRPTKDAWTTTAEVVAAVREYSSISCPFDTGPHCRSDRSAFTGIQFPASSMGRPAKAEHPRQSGPTHAQVGNGLYASVSKYIKSPFATVGKTFHCKARAFCPSSYPFSYPSCLCPPPAGERLDFVISAPWLNDSSEGLQVFTLLRIFGLLK